MATGIRQKRVGRTTGTVNVRSAPTVQNVVVPRRGVVSYNPMEGASQVGAGIASRLEGMGRDVNNFFKSLSGSAMNIAEVEHRKNLVEIKEENERQQAQARVDELENPGERKTTNMPGLQDQSLLNDRDYYDTRLKIRAINHASEAGSLYNEEMNNLPLGTNFTQHFADHVSNITEGMELDYETYFVAALRDKVKPAMDEHITNVVRADEERLRVDFKSRIYDAMGVTLDSNGEWQNLNPAGSINKILNHGTIGTYITEARKLYPGTATEGQLKAIVVGHVLDAAKHAKDSGGTIRHVLGQLATDPELGDGTQTFAQLHPEAFQKLSGEASKVTNEYFKRQAEGVTQEIKNMQTALADGTATVPEVIRLLGSSKVKEFKNVNDGVRTAYAATIKAVNKMIKDRAPMTALTNWGKGAFYDRKLIKKLDGTNAFSSPSGGQMYSRLLNAGHGKDFPNQNATIRDSITSKNLLGKPDDPSTQFAQTSAMRSLETITNSKISRPKIKSLFGDHALAIYDSYENATQLGVNPADAVVAAITKYSPDSVKKNLDAIDDRDIARAVRNQSGSTKLMEHDRIRKVIRDVDGLENAQIPAALTDEVLGDIKREIAVTDQDVTKDVIKETLEKVVADIPERYHLVPDSKGENVRLVPNNTPSKQQNDSLFRKSEDGEMGVDGFKDATKQVVTQKVDPKASLEILAGGSAPQQDAPNFIDSVMPKDGTYTLDIENPLSRKHGSGGVIAENGTRVRFGVGQVLTQGDKTLKIVSDRHPINETGSFTPVSSFSDAMKDGGLITITEFVRGFNEEHGYDIGFSLIPRHEANGNVSYSLEYDSTVLTPDEARKADQDELARLKKEGQALGWMEKIRMGLGGIDYENMTPKEARDEYEKKGGFIEQNSNALGYGITNKPVGNAMRKKALERSNDRVSQVETQTELSNIAHTVMRQGQRDGTISDAVNVTKHDIPEKIASVEELMTVVEKAHDDKKKSKGGLPNQPISTPVEDTYIAKRNASIYSDEGIRTKAYLDTNDNPSVGVGFNLKDPVVKTSLMQMIGEDKYKLLMKEAKYDDESKKTVELTEPQMDAVFEAVIAEKESHVSTWYKDIDLTEEQRATIVNLAYQGGGTFVGPTTEFYKAVKKGDWDSAIYEIKHRSNAKDIQGIQNRMDRHSDVLSNNKTQPSLFGPTASLPKKDALDKFLAAINPISSAQAGQAMAAVNPNGKLPTSKEGQEALRLWSTEGWAAMKDHGETALAHVAQGVVSFVTPTDSSEMLFSDFVLKGMAGMKLGRKVMTEKDIKIRSFIALRALAKTALSKGKKHITWSDYGNDLFGAPIAGIIGHKKGVKEADKTYPKTPMGFLKLGLMTMLDANVDMAMTIGQGTLTTDKDGNVILTDTYDIEQFLGKSRSEGIYGWVRNYIGQPDRVTLESDPDDEKIKWRINLGKLN